MDWLSSQFSSANSLPHLKKKERLFVLSHGSAVTHLWKDVPLETLATVREMSYTTSPEVSS